MDEIEAYYVEGSKPEKETPTEYIQIYTLNLERGNKDPVSPESNIYVKNRIWDYVGKARLE